LLLREGVDYSNFSFSGFVEIYGSGRVP
jgi:hypothetical protein